MESLYYNAVAVAVGGDYGKLGKLRNAFGTWAAAYENLPLIATRPDAEKEWARLERLGITLLLREDAHFPFQLTQISHPPFALYILGRLHAPEVHPFAIVGTRRATPEGKKIARRFGYDISRAGFVVTSGLAFGVDAAAHEGCLDAEGITIAVLACGLDDIYPHENKKLATRILDTGGAIVSEYPPGEPPYEGRFLERNRIVSGISRGVLVVEAPQRSGSLATARYALDQNRDVFVVPGPITHGNFAGSHELIRQGATLVRNAEDILEAYGLAESDRTTKDPVGATPEETQVLGALRSAQAPLDVDKISAMTKLEPRIVNQALALLIIEGRVKESAGGYTI